MDRRHRDAMLRLEVAHNLTCVPAGAIVGIYQAQIAVSRQLHCDVVARVLPIVPDALYAAVIFVAGDNDRTSIGAVLFDSHYLLEAARPILMSLPHIDADELYLLVHVFVFQVYFEPEKLIRADIGSAIDEQDAARNIVDLEVAEQLFDVLAAQLKNVLALDDELLANLGLHNEVSNSVPLRNEPNSLLRAFDLVAARAATLVLQ